MTGKDLYEAQIKAGATQVVRVDGQGLLHAGRRPMKDGFWQKLIDAYAKKFEGLRFSYETVSVDGYGTPPFEFQMTVHIEDRRRFNVMITRIKEGEEIQWSILESMIDAGAEWARDWLDRQRATAARTGETVPPPSPDAPGE